MEELKPITMPGTHQAFLKYFKSKKVDKGMKILDVGAGHGAFTKELHDMGYQVQACDLFPEEFHYKKIVCDKVDITQVFPYGDNTFDLAIAIEVSEHILDHEMFFKELSRIIKPTGSLYISTPNIMSLKSRFRFLFQGFFYSFRELEKNNYDGLQHVSSLTYDQYHYLAIKSGFLKPEIDIDKKQSSSSWLFILMYPFIKLAGLRRKFSKVHNYKKLLLGRLLFLNFRNGKQS